MKVQALALVVIFGALSSCGSATDTVGPTPANDIGSLPAVTPTEVDTSPPETLTSEVERTTTTNAAPTPKPGDATATAYAVDEELTVLFDVPESFGPSRSPSKITDRDRGNGLFVLERWTVEESPLDATLSVQIFPGETSQLVRNLSDPVASANGLDWRVLEGGEASPHEELIIAFARHGDYLFGISGEQFVFDQLVVGITTKEVGQ